MVSSRMYEEVLEFSFCRLSSVYLQSPQLSLLVSCKRLGVLLRTLRYVKITGLGL